MTNTHQPGKPPRILLLEDDRFDMELIQEHLGALDPQPEIAMAVDRAAYTHALEQGGVDVILSDYSLPDFDGMGALDLATKMSPETPFIFVSGVLGEEIAIESFKKGATDYVLKQKLLRLAPAVERALHESRERAKRRKAERQMEMLVAELSHRVKNTLASVMSIARQTYREGESTEEYRDSLLSRLRALSDAHALVFEVNWQEARLDQVLDRTVAPFRRPDDERIRVFGPQVKVRPAPALALTLIFHELVSNATSHGSLSVPTGSVNVTWKAEPADNGTERVAFEWVEKDGPAVEQPQRTGFGTLLMQRSAQYELDGGAELDYEPTGLVCRLNFATG